MDSSEALLSATRNPNVLASVANVPIEAAREALKRGLQLQRSEYLSCLKQQRVILERKMKAELKRRVEPAKPPQPETEKIQLRIQDLAKEIELLKQKVSNADDSMQNRVSQLTDTLDNIKTDAGEGKPSDAAQQTPDKAPVAASASEKTPDKAPAAEETPENAPPATASTLDQTPDKTPGGSESATPVEPVMTEDLPPVEELNVSLDEPLTVVQYHSEEEEEEEDYEEARFRDRVKRFYAEFNPSKLHNVDRLLQTYRGREQELIVKLHQRYNVPFSRTNGAPPPPPVSPKEKELSPAKPRSKSFARGMFNAVKTVFAKKKDREPSRNRAVSAGNPQKAGSGSARSRSDSSGSGKPKRINRAKSVTNNIAQWLMGKRDDEHEGASQSCLNELRKLRLEVQKYQEQEACLKQEAQTLRDVVRERDACHSSETESLKDVVKAMHDEMKRLCEENDSLKLQISGMRDAGGAEGAL